MKLINYKFSQREKILICLLVAVLGFVLFYQVFWVKQWPHYCQLKDDLQVANARLAKVKREVSQASELNKKMEQLESDWDAVKKHLDLTLTGTTAFIQAAQPADEAVEILGFEPQMIDKKGSFRIYPYRVTVKGPYPSLVNYLAQLESLPALTTIHDLEIVSLKENSSVEAKFLVDLYESGESKIEARPLAIYPKGRYNSFVPPVNVSNNKNEEEKTDDKNVLANQSSNNNQNQDHNSSENSEYRQKLSVTTNKVLYTFPLLQNGELVEDSDFKPVTGEEDIVWLQQLRVLRNVGPFFRLGKPAAIAGRKFSHAISVKLNKDDPKAEVTVDLERKYDRLTGYVGIDDSTCNTSGAACLTVKVDGKQLYQRILKPGDYPGYLELPVFFGRKLSFYVEWREGGFGDYNNLIVDLGRVYFK
ncbi:MAG: hypothetical protein PWP31_66 [Clostridia bacterium]|nr:hypothetical protein [Clostridia bacterium]